MNWSLPAGVTMREERHFGDRLVRSFAERPPTVYESFRRACAARPQAEALVCGDTIVWKPSTMTPLTSMACSALLDRAASECGAPAGVHRLTIADARTGAMLVDSPDVALVSASLPSHSMSASGASGRANR